MSVTLKWTRGVETETQSLEAWGVTDAQLRLVSGGIGTLSLETSESILDDPQWQTEDLIELFNGSTRVFYGHVQPAPADASSRAERQRYLVTDPSRKLSRWPFIQPWNVYDPDEEGLPPADFGRVFLFINSRGTADEITAALTLAKDDTPVGCPLAIGTIDAQMLPPPEKNENRTCLQIIQRCVQRCVDAATWWDYSGTGYPTFYARRWANLDTLTIDPLSESVDRIQIGETVENRLNYIRVFLKKQQARKSDGTLASGSDPISFWSTDADSFTSVLYPPTWFSGGGTKEGGATISTDWDSTFTEVEALAAATLAHTAANNVAWAGTVSLWRAEPLWTARPGLKLRISNARTAWATMDALVQEVTHDIFAGRTTIKYGPPTQLGFADIEELIRFWAGRRPSANDKQEQTDGTSPTENYGFDKKEPKSPDSIFEFTVPTTLGWATLRFRAESGVVLSAPPYSTNVPRVDGTTPSWYEITTACPETP